MACPGVVDGENLLFLEDATQRVIDGLVGLQVVTQGLFQHHAGGRAVEAHGGDLFAHVGEQAGGRGHIHHYRVRSTRVQQLGQALVIFGLGKIHAQVLQQRCKLCKFFCTGAFGQVHTVKA